MRAQKDMQKAPVANYTSLQDQLLELREGEQKDTAYLNAAQRIRITKNPSPLNDTKPVLSRNVIQAVPKFSSGRLTRPPRCTGKQGHWPSRGTTTTCAEGRTTTCAEGQPLPARPVSQRDCHYLRRGTSHYLRRGTTTTCQSGERHGSSTRKNEFP